MSKGKSATDTDLVRSTRITCNKYCPSKRKSPAGKYVCDHTSLKTLYPEIAAEWNYEKNENLKPEDFTYGSGMSVWWKCLKDKNFCGCHIWKSTIHNRTRGKACPFCCEGSRKTCPHSDYTLLHMYPEIAAEFDYVKNYPKRPEHFVPYSHENIWWICNNCPSGDKTCHSWNVIIKARTKGGNCCPYCVHQKICSHMSLKITHPDLASQWHMTLNSKGPEEFSYGSGYKPYWNCPKGHIYSSYIYNRSIGQGCPTCNESRGEKECNKILTELSLKFISENNPFPELGRKKAYDFVLPECRTIIEYDGNQHFELCYFTKTPDQFEHKRNIDILKHQTAISSGYKMIRIDYTIPLSEIKHHIINGLQQDNHTYFSTPEMYQWL